jgi:hypothetical protein
VPLELYKRPSSASLPAIAISNSTSIRGGSKVSPIRTMESNRWPVVSEEPLSKPTLTMDASARSPDGRRLARTVNGGIAICDAANGDEILRLEMPTVHRHIAFAPDGTSLVSVSESDGAFVYWPGKR